MHQKSCFELADEIERLEDAVKFWSTAARTLASQRAKDQATYKQFIDYCSERIENQEPSAVLARISDEHIKLLSNGFIPSEAIKPGSFWVSTSGGGEVVRVRHVVSEDDIVYYDWANSVGGFHNSDRDTFGFQVRYMPADSETINPEITNEH